MKMKLQEKYMTLSYKERLLDQWQCLIQSNRLMSYINQFDGFLNRCGENESNVVFLSRFRSGLREDFRQELFVRDISTLEQAYQSVWDLDRFKLLLSLDVQAIEIMPTRPLLLNLNPIRPNLSLILGLVALLQGVKTKARESPVSQSANSML